MFASFVCLIIFFIHYCCSYGLTSTTEPWKSGFGIFDSNWNSKRKSASEIDDEVGNIFDMGMTMLVIKYGCQSRVGDSSNIYYSSALTWASGFNKYPDHIENFLKSAKKRNMEVYIGMYADGISGDSVEGEEWFEKGEDIVDSYLTRQASRTIEVFDEIYNQFVGTYGSTIKGWYIPHEISRDYWSISAQRTRLSNLMMKPITDHIHSKGQKVLICPFYNMDLNNVTEEGLFWDSLFSLWKPDILAVQDGIGSKGDHMDLARLPDWLSTIKSSCVSAGVDFWVNVELFNNSTLNPQTFETIESQIEIAATYGARVISYDYSTLEGDEDDGVMEDYYDDLVNLYNRNRGESMKIDPESMRRGPFFVRDIKTKCSLQQCIISANSRSGGRRSLLRNVVRDMYFVLRSNEFPFFTVGRKKVNVSTDNLDFVKKTPRFSIGVFGMFEYKKLTTGDFFNPEAGDIINKWYYFGVGNSKVKGERIGFGNIAKSYRKFGDERFYKFRLLPRLKEASPNFPRFALCAFAATSTFAEPRRGNLSKMVIDENALKISLNITNCKCNVSDSDGIGIAMFVVTSGGIGKRFENKNFDRNIDYPNRPSLSNEVFDSISDVGVGGYISFRKDVGVFNGTVVRKLISNLKVSKASDVQHLVIMNSTIQDKLMVRDRNIQVIWMTVPRCDLNNLYWDPSVGYDKEENVDVEEDVNSDCKNSVCIIIVVFVMFVFLKI